MTTVMEVSYKRLGELEARLRGEVQQGLALGGQVEGGECPLPEGWVIQDEVARRQDRVLGQSNHDNMVVMPSANLFLMPE